MPSYFAPRGGRTPLILLASLALLATVAPARADLRQDAHGAMRRAAGFFDGRLSVDGSYVWKYDRDDPLDRKGEDEVTPSQGWVQPPGTPAVGLAYLRAFAATGDPAFLESARRAAAALADTQLVSGGWWYRIEFDPEARRAWCYRAEPEPCPDASDNKFRDASTLDDNTTQSALIFLMLTDEATRGRDPLIRGAIRYGLERLRASQHPNGAWPVRLDWDEAGRAGVVRASVPEAWPRDFVHLRRPFYSLNDHLMRNVIRVFLLAHHLYGDPADLEAARRAGDFLLAARLPAPQPGWAQTYDAGMVPAWGRRFEPPALASGESAGCVDALLDLYRYTGDRRYVATLGATVDWLERGRLPDGRWPRFFELGTNRPLYMTREYDVTYAPDDLPKHYTFVGDLGIPAVVERYRRTVAEPAAAGAPEADRGLRLARLAGAVAPLIDRLDAEGRWVEKGEIRSTTFVDNLTTLAEFIALDEGRTGPMWRDLSRFGAAR